MELSYVIPYTRYQNNTGLTIGVDKKIQYQEKALEKNLVSVSRFELVIDSRTPIKFLKSIFHSYNKLHGIFNDNKGEVVYCRNLFPYISYSILIRKNRAKKIVYEIQDIPSKMVRIRKSNTVLVNLQSTYILLMERLVSRYILKHASGIVAVTSEISEYYSKRYLIPSLTLGNGISTVEIPLKKQSYLDSELHILSVAVIQNYHGIDRFIRGLHEYNAHYANSTKIVLHIVGDGPELPYLKELTDELGLNENVIFHGFKSGRELDEMFDICHIAIGSLAGFRVGLNELSSLKSREYCARGIPFLMASKDADFPDDFAWVQMVPANENLLDMNLVINFAERVMSDPEHPQKMRKYAEENLDWVAKMKVLKEFLESL